MRGDAGRIPSKPHLAAISYPADAAASSMNRASASEDGSPSSPLPLRASPRASRCGAAAGSRMAAAASRMAPAAPDPLPVPNALRSASSMAGSSSGPGLQRFRGRAPSPAAVSDTSK